MSSHVSSETESCGRQFYCRKEKSLGVLCSNFLGLYNRDGVDLIGLDDAASRLGVERRRIYDVVNILESVGVVARKGKNQYSWKGFEEIPRALNELKEEGFKENLSTSSWSISVKVTNCTENGELLNATDGQENSSSSSKVCVESKREKSLWLLTQNFVKLFLCSDVDMITLDSAAMALLGESHNSTAMRTKVRRLYDIANVFSSMNLIEKIPHPETRKPAFRWLGWRGKPCNEAGTTTDLKESKKRVFGTEISNFTSKRNKVDFSADWKGNQEENKSMRVKSDNLGNDNNVNKMKQHSNQSSKSFDFGPFAPGGMSTVRDSRNNNVEYVEESKNLTSTYKLQYRNQALTELFGHYVEAWKSWHAEFPGKNR